jgi:hypothetical protein
MKPDPLDDLLHEWEAPEPSRALDARVRASFPSTQRRPFWRSLLAARVTIPVPVLAAALVMIAMGLWLERSSPPAHPANAAPPAGYLTRLDTAGFRPLPDGEVRVIRSGEKK